MRKKSLDYEHDKGYFLATFHRFWGCSTLEVLCEFRLDLPYTSVLPPSFRFAAALMLAKFRFCAVLHWS